MRTTRRQLFASAVAAAFAADLVKNGRLKQSVSRWPHAKIPLSDFCRAVADMGLTAVDLLTEVEWPVARPHGLVCSMGPAGGGSIRDGLNVKANHDAIVDTGFGGFLAHEFVPTRDPLGSLREAVTLCDV